jgi:hypothetical protein
MGVGEQILTNYTRSNKFGMRTVTTTQDQIKLAYENSYYTRSKLNGG